MLHLRRVVPRRRSPSRRLRPRSRQPTVPSRTGARRRQASPSVSLSRRLCLPRLHIRPSGKSSSRRAWHPSLRSVALCCREYPAPRSHQPPAIDSSLGRVTDALPWLRAARMERLAHSFVDFEARRAFRLTQKARVPMGVLTGSNAPLWMGAFRTVRRLSRGRSHWGFSSSSSPAGSPRPMCAAAYSTGGVVEQFAAPLRTYLTPRAPQISRAMRRQTTHHAVGSPVQRHSPFATALVASACRAEVCCVRSRLNF